MVARRWLVWVVWACGAACAGALDPVVLMPPVDPAAGWSFDNGQEFPGAKGGISVDTEFKRDGRPTLKLLGDFTGGGGYVQASLKKLTADPSALSFWLRNTDLDKLTIRVVDGSSQCHQMVFKLEKSEDWQQFNFPLERWFARRGQADAPPGVIKYEYWGGAKDGRWHGPANSIHLLLGRPGDKAPHTLWFQDMAMLPRPVAVAGVEVAKTFALDELLEGEPDWRFELGQEFKGAKGEFKVVRDQPAAGQSCFKLAGDFNGGGAYVGIYKNLADLEVKDVSVIRLRYKSEKTVCCGLQLVDGSGQTHQRKDIRLVADDTWHDLELVPSKIAGGEHWGGANDGKWHGPPALLGLTLAVRGEPTGKQPSLLLAEIRAEATLPVFAQPAAYRCDFEAPALPAGWQTVGGATLDKAAWHGTGALTLARTVDQTNQPCEAASPRFTVAPGLYELSTGTRAELNSPDNSYHAALLLELFDAAGKSLDRLTLGELTGRSDWAELSKRVELPRGAAEARFVARLDKTWGRCSFDDLSAVCLAPPARKDDRLARIVMSSSSLGGLLLPTDPRKMSLSVEATKPLRDSQKTVTWTVRDYWGAEQAPAGTVTLSAPTRKNKQYLYTAEVDLGGLPLEVGRYYEFHVAVPQPDQPPFVRHTSLAILPEAPNKQFKPDEIPFTSRNWDNRISEYIRLTDRLGVRVVGLWGGWSEKPPYKPHAPGLELAKQLGLGVLTGTPCATIEAGKHDYTPEALAQGVRNWLETYGAYRPLVINLGNEPHGTGQRVLDNVAAYKTVYEAIKAVDKTIPVVATSVEPNEEYFAAGYGKYCDAYDFHIYEEYPNVARTMAQYRDLMRKYDVVKPIWSTELGLNSQGMTRLAVASELYKKVATFFAAGGASVSWFGLLYPDGEGKLYGTSGEAHNVFDCRYNKYAPKLDAVAYYNAVNALGIKKFVAERRYAHGVQDYLFADRDGRRLQVLWQDKGRSDLLVPLAGVDEVEVIHIDGRHSRLSASGGGVTLSVASDPVLLLYRGGASTLPEAPGQPLASVVQAPDKLARAGGDLTLKVADGAKVAARAPLGWTADLAGTRLSLKPAAGSAVHTAEVVLGVHNAAGAQVGELVWRAPLE